MSDGRRDAGKRRLVRPNDIDNPEEGELCSGKFLGFSGGLFEAKKCIKCGKIRWGKLNSIRPHCRECWKKYIRFKIGQRASNWKGGRRITKKGYVIVNITDKNQFFGMAGNLSKSGKTGEIYEHRLLMAQYLDRPLSSSEEVHHWDENKANNSMDNLFLTRAGEHNSRYKHGEKTGYRDGYSQAYKDVFIKTVRLLQTLEKKSLSNALSIGR